MPIPPFILSILRTWGGVIGKKKWGGGKKEITDSITFWYQATMCSWQHQKEILG